MKLFLECLIKEKFVSFVFIFYQFVPRESIQVLIGNQISNKLSYCHQVSQTTNCNLGSFS